MGTRLIVMISDPLGPNKQANKQKQKTTTTTTTKKNQKNQLRRPS